jgi:hypothetical protein
VNKNQNLPAVISVHGKKISKESDKQQTEDDVEGFTKVVSKKSRRNTGCLVFKVTNFSEIHS